MTGALKNLKRWAMLGGGAAIALIPLNGLHLKMTERSFCARVNRFIDKGETEIVSLIADAAPGAAPGERAEPRGYRIAPVIAPPFYWTGAAGARRERLILGERYYFTAVGLSARWLGLYPIIAADRPGAEHCAHHPSAPPASTSSPAGAPPLTTQP